ncbi:MAG: NAD(P)-dependent oxidoreductase [Nanoarchaeota archaeon]|nr:NAD(P)-dependent oxidoreductase [Nanoarchaeota archaeon]
MILITGATGFLGKNLTKNLIQKGHKVRILSRDEDKAKSLFPKAEIFKGDLSDPRSLDDVSKGINTVIHLAGLVSYSKPKNEIFSANVDTTKNLLEECKNVKKFIFASSVSVYGEIKKEADESYRLDPKNYYGLSKLRCEELIKNSGIPYVMLRIAPVYGEGSPSWKKNLKLLEKGFPVPKTKNLTHVVHISDVVQAFEKSIKKGKGTYNIADKKPLSFTEFVETIMKLLGKKPKRMPMLLVKTIAKSAGMGAYFNVLIINRHYIINKAKNELNYEPKADFSTEVKKMVNWYKGL